MRAEHLDFVVHPKELAEGHVHDVSLRRLRIYALAGKTGVNPALIIASQNVSNLTPTASESMSLRRIALFVTAVMRYRSDVLSS